MMTLTIESVPIHGDRCIYVVRLPETLADENGSTSKEGVIGCADALCVLLQRYEASIILPHDVQLEVKA